MVMHYDFGPPKRPELKSWKAKVGMFIVQLIVFIASLYAIAMISSIVYNLK